ncbi:MAG: DUF5906 domain-containing protein [Pseudomonadota bacterium]
MNAHIKPPPVDEVDPKARREAQRRENVAIGEGSNEIPTATILSLDELLAEYVFIQDGSQVAPLHRPQAYLSLSDFRNAMAGSKHRFENGEGQRKTVPAVKAWLEHPDRLEAEALTFRAGGDRIVAAPGSNRRAFNLWAPIKRLPVSDNWQQLAAVFVDHVRWLWGADADKFLDWLAHIEQSPGQLPHYGWVHVSREHGKGRNWISSVLARVWEGHVAASLDLVAMLSTNFNGQLSRKMLAIVDEINEGGSASHRHAQKLREIVTVERRDINPKYGRPLVEYNSCRWLLFSNHTGALPLTEDDRRFWIVSHDGSPKAPEYYSRLYGALAHPSFVPAVAEFLRQRDNRHFNPGEHPPMNAAKEALVGFSRSEADLTLAEITAHWPVDVITRKELRLLMEGVDPGSAAGKHALDRAGILPITETPKVKVATQGSQRAHAVRNANHWLKAGHAQLKAEIERIGIREKLASGGWDDRYEQWNQQKP